jgi:hypothetical protein
MILTLPFSPYSREVFGEKRRHRTGSFSKEDHPTNISHASGRMESIFQLCIYLENTCNSPDLEVFYGKTTAQGLRESEGFAGCHRNPFALLSTNILSLDKKQISDDQEISPKKRIKMKAMGLSEEAIESISSDPSPRNVRRELRGIASDFLNPMSRECALKMNATDGLPVVCNRVDSRMEYAVRTKENLILFANLIKGKIKALAAFENLQQQIIKHFEAAVNHLDQQKNNIITLKNLFRGENLEDSKTLKSIKSIFLFFKKTKQPGIGSKVFKSPIQKINGKSTIKKEDIATLFTELEKHLEEVKQRLKINQEQLEGTKSFKTENRLFFTPDRAKVQKDLLALRNSVDSKKTSSVRTLAL